MKHDTARTHHGIGADREPAHHRGIGAYGRSFSDQGFFQDPGIPAMAAGVAVIDKGHSKRNEGIVLDGDAIENSNTILEGHMIADHRPFFYITTIPNVAMCTDHRSFHDIGIGPDTGAFPDLRIGMDYSSFVFKIIHRIDVLEPDQFPATIDGFPDRGQGTHYICGFTGISQQRRLVFLNTLDKILGLRL